MIKPTKAAKMFTAALLLFAFASCKKDNSVEELTAANTISQAEVAAAQAIAVSVSTETNGDSVYVIGTCPSRHRTDSIPFSSLPASVSSYLDANYSGYTFKKAFTDKDPSGTISGYVAIISYNGNPVGLKFDATGAFVKVLEQREGRDLREGRGFHAGGRFEDRDGKRRDTIAVTSLSTNITAYLAANFAQDTLVRAFKGKDNSIVVLSINNGAYASIFDANGAFVKRTALPARQGRPSSVNQDALPAAALSYMSTTYPNYVFKHAFVVRNNNVVAGYAVFIDANGTKYALQFDANGAFVKAITVR